MPPYLPPTHATCVSLSHACNLQATLPQISSMSHFQGMGHTRGICAKGAAGHPSTTEVVLLTANAPEHRRHVGLQRTNVQSIPWAFMQEAQELRPPHQAAMGAESIYPSTPFEKAGVNRRQQDTQFSQQYDLPSGVCGQDIKSSIHSWPLAAS